MKKILLILLIIVFNNSKAQSIINDFTFNLHTLSVQKAYAIDSILPRTENNKFYYFNQKTGKKIFDTYFEEAYPFMGKSALIKKNGKYGVIDLKGDYLIKPQYKDFNLPPYESESNLIIFSEDYIFDLSTAKKNETGYVYCAEPAFPSFTPFQNKDKKYGIKNLSNEIIKPKYDSIIDIHFDYFVCQLNNKIGVLNTNGEILIPFNYDNVTFSRGMYYISPQIIGLEKNGKWTYFELSNPDSKEIISSKHKCFQMHNLDINNAIGIFKEGKHFNILFKNGKTLDKDYDWISGNGLVGIRNNAVFFLNSDGSSTLYYERK